jgi:hypothetical protein
MSNSFSFSKKKDMKPNPAFWGLSLTTMSGVPENMKVFTPPDRIWPTPLQSHPPDATPLL